MFLAVVSKKMQTRQALGTVDKRGYVCDKAYQKHEVDSVTLTLVKRFSSKPLLHDAKVSGPLC